MKAAAVHKADLQKAKRDGEARAVEEKTRIAEAMTRQQQKFAAAQRCTSAWAAVEANARAAGFCYQEQTAAARFAQQALPATPAPPAPPVVAPPPAPAPELPTVAAIASEDGLRWVVRPSFSIAAEAFVDERVGFLREADVDAERLGRWLN